MTYQTQINATKPDGWINVKGDDYADAAINALRRVGVKAVTWPCVVYVGETKYKHKNGAPLVVHAFTLALTEDQAA